MPINDSGTQNTSLYRAIWRWHFYAGLISIPFLVLLAATGSLYLFKDEIDRSVFSDRNVVAVLGTRLSPEAIVTAALATTAGASATSYKDPASADASAIVTVATDQGDAKVYADPYTGRVLDNVGSEQEFNHVVKKIHSLEILGKYPNRWMEAIGGFAIILTISGIYLWWPRDRLGGVFKIRWMPGRRALWRDLHAVSGAYLGLLALFLAVSGMPWSGVWGSQVNSLATDLGVGYPEMLWDAVPTSDVPLHYAVPSAGWTVENSPMPKSTPEAAARPIGLDKAIEIAKGRGIAEGFDMTLPDGPEGVYTASIFPDRLADQRTIHIHQYSGKPIVDLTFADYGGAAKAIEWGINVHMGQEWGLFNQLLMLSACLAIILMSVSASVMWWKRRPRGRVGVPPYPTDRGVYGGLWLIALMTGLAFPMTGISVLAMLCFDLLIIRTIPPLRRAFA